MPKLVRALVQVTLLDLANRKPQLRDTEIPFWLTVGFTQILLTQPDLVLVIRKPESGRKEMATEEVIRTVRRHDPLAGARARLNGRRAFDFSEISMPSPSHLRVKAEGLSGLLAPAGEPVAHVADGAAAVAGDDSPVAGEPQLADGFH